MILVSEYDPGWASRFDALRIEFERAMAAAGVPIVAIEHVGSTSVVGLAAKPIIDLDIVVTEANVAGASAVLTSLGFEAEGELGIPQRWAFRPPSRWAGTAPYVIVAGSLALKNHLAVRDTLRRRPDLRDEYGEVKKGLGTRVADLYDYGAGKSATVQRILAAAGLTDAERASIDANLVPRRLPRPTDDEYPDYEAIEDELGAMADESLDPRGPESLYDYVTEMNLPPRSQALDIGCNRGTHTVELHRRFGFRVTGIDPSAEAISIAQQSAEQANVTDDVKFRTGRIEAIPAEPESVDLVWCRDTIELVSDLDPAFHEVHRVLRPGGRALIWTMCATDLITSEETVLVIENLGVIARSMGADYIDRCIKTAGLNIDHCDILGSEWGEYSQEHLGKPAQRLLRVARLLRQPDRFIERFGRRNYDLAVADYLWPVYRMIGKLSSRIYVLSRR